SPYAAPEQAESGAVMRESDLFSLGAMLCEMLTGLPPRGGSAPSRLVRGLPAGLDDVLHRALRPDPRDRYHSGEELAAALDRISE
ncbi:MAG: serine/threonine protein kinase, partial [candidate division NC10 bacterium]